MKIKKSAIVIIAAVFLAAVFSLALFLNIYAGKTLLKEADDSIRIAVSSALQDASSMDARRESIEGSFDTEYFQRADAVSYMLNSIDSGDSRQQTLSNYKTLLGADNIVLIDGEGTITDFAVSTKTNFKDSAFKPITDLLNAGADRHVVEAASGDALYRYYGSIVDSDHIAVLAVNRRVLEKLTDGFTGWYAKLDGVTPWENGYYMVVSKDTSEILYHPNEKLVGKDVGDILSGSFEMTDGFSGNLMLDGQKCRVVIKESNNAYVLAAAPLSDIYGTASLLIGLVLFFFASFLIVITVYALGIHEGEMEEKALSSEAKTPQNKFSRKVFAGTLLYVIIGTIVICTVFNYVDRISLIGSQSITNKRELQNAENLIEYYAEETGIFNDNADAIVLTKADTVAYIIENKADSISEQELSEIASRFGLNSITIYNKNSSIRASAEGVSLSGPIELPANISSQFSKIIKGSETSMLASCYDEASGVYVKYGATVLRNGENEKEGFVSVLYEPKQLEKAVVQGNVSNILSNLAKSSKGTFMAVSKDTGNIVYSASRKSVGLSADELNLYSGFSGYLTLNGEECFADCIGTGDYLVVSSLPLEKILRNIQINTATVTGFAALLFIIYAVVLSLKMSGEAKEGTEQVLEFILPDGSIKRRFAGGGKINRWKEKTPAQKASAVVKAMFLLLCGIITLIYIFSDKLLRSDSILNYIIDENWEKGLNIFAVTSAMISVSVIIMIRQIIDFMLELLASNSDARTETICRLVISFLKYITVLLCVYYCLAKFGVDTGTLVASAGLLSLIIGLGAQDLIKDILAGLFIIFEQEFKVGDIVTVDDFTGTVREIGIRATKIEDLGQNIKIINNNQISGILNKTKKYSYAIVDVGIEYSESIERVEKVLEKELPEVKKKLPDIISGPTYKGVVELADSSVVIRVIATCTEGKRIPLTFALNREIKLIFDRNDINIPFNQVVVHKED